MFCFLILDKSAKFPVVKQLLVNCHHYPYTTWNHYFRVGELSAIVKTTTFRNSLIQHMRRVHGSFHVGFSVVVVTLYSYMVEYPFV